jgi:hypothetical protein
MKHGITYYWGKDDLLIDLGNRTKLRIKLLYFGEFLFASCMAAIFLAESFPFSRSITHVISGIGASILLLLASGRLLLRLSFREALQLDKYSLTIIRKRLWFKQCRSYNWQYIGMLHYAAKKPKTDHPLKGKSFDYFGLDTHEQLIQSLHHDGNLFFDYGDNRIYFGRGVYSWDAEKMVNMMKLFTGTLLHLGPEWEQMLQTQELDDVQ